MVGMRGEDVQQESSRYDSNHLMTIAKLAAAAVIPTAAMAVQGAGFGRAKEGESSGGHVKRFPN